MNVTLLRTHTPENQEDLDSLDPLPSLTPELLAASLARYSRSDEGIEAIINKIDFGDHGKSVDNIFKLSDFGHASIKDLSGGIPMTIDGISQWLAYKIFSESPTGSGQQSSTRYIKVNSDAVIDFELTGLHRRHKGTWGNLIHDYFSAYEHELERLNGEAHKDEQLGKILSDDTISAKKKERLKRNYAFDRARVFLPAAAKTNVAMILSARGWCQLITFLSSCPYPEATILADKLREKLKEVTPRLIKHSYPEESYIQQIKAELRHRFTDLGSKVEVNISEASDEVLSLPKEVFDIFFAGKQNRYSRCGKLLSLVSVEVSWAKVDFACVRDISRHRTGSHYWLEHQHGFYIPPEINKDRYAALLERQANLFKATKNESQAMEMIGHQYTLFFGSQSPFFRTTTLDKFIYELNLRTGLGAHRDYANLYREAAEKLFEIAPNLRDHVKLGEGEPE